MKHTVRKSEQLRVKGR